MVQTPNHLCFEVMSPQRLWIQTLMRVWFSHIKSLDSSMPFTCPSICFVHARVRHSNYCCDLVNALSMPLLTSLACFHVFACAHAHLHVACTQTEMLAHHELTEGHTWTTSSRLDGSKTAFCAVVIDQSMNIHLPRESKQTSHFWRDSTQRGQHSRILWTTYMWL